MEKWVVRITPSGTIETLYTDKLPLLDLGEPEIHRVTQVEFSNEEKVWVATEIATGKVIAKSPSREECIRKEREYIFGKWANESR